MNIITSEDDYPWEMGTEGYLASVSSLNPTETQDRSYLLHYSEEKHRQAVIAHGSVSGSELGKWMVFCDNPNADATFARAKAAYDEGRLSGVRYIRVSCNRRSRFELSREKRVIFFYCGPSSDEDAVKETGRNVLKQIEHQRQACDEDEGFHSLFYKDETQRLTGSADAEEYVGGRSRYSIPLP